MAAEYAWVGWAFIAVLVAYTLYLNMLAMLVVRYSVRLTPFQRIAQAIVVWTIPLLGAALVLHLLFLDVPNLMPRAWIPWPFKKLIYGEPIKPNKNRSTLRIPYYFWRR